MPGLKLSWSVQVFAYTKPGHKDWEMQLFVQMHKTQQGKKKKKKNQEVKGKKAQSKEWNESSKSIVKKQTSMDYLTNSKSSF